MGFEGSDSLTFFNRVHVDIMYREIQNLLPDLNRHPELMELGAEAEYLTKLVPEFERLNQFSVGVGLTIPWRGSSKLRYQDIAIQQLETQFEKNQITQEVLSQLNKKKSEFEFLYTVYKKHKNQQTNPEWVAVRDKIVQ